MSYANWNSTAFYLADDIVIYNGEDYQALVANHNVVPVGNPATWNVIAPPGPGPSNQLNFVQATTDLSIVGGNTIDISPKLVYTASSDPTTNALSVGNTNVVVSTIPQLTFAETTTGVLARPIIQTLVDDPAPPPANPPPYRLIDAQYIKNTNELWRFYIDVIAGSPTLGSEFTTGGVNSGMVINAEPLVLNANQGPNQFRLHDVPNNVSGDLWVRADGSLMWNTNVVSPTALETGQVGIQNPNTTISVATTTTLGPKPVISLTYTDDGSVNVVPPTGQSAWFVRTGANSFDINLSAPAGVPNGVIQVSYAILAP